MVTVIVPIVVEDVTLEESAPESVSSELSLGAFTSNTPTAVGNAMVLLLKVPPIPA